MWEKEEKQTDETVEPKENEPVLSADGTSEKNLHPWLYLMLEQEVLQVVEHLPLCYLLTSNLTQEWR